ncbi:MAG: hypothetical protein ACPLTR_01185 [Thermacetogeniaceae bacterium]
MKLWGNLLIYVAAGYLFSLVMIPFLFKMLRDAGAVRPNYRSEEIPVGAGMFIPFVYCAVVIAMQRFQESKWLIFLFGLTYFGLLGLVDDLLGSRSSTGFKGHFSSLIRGKLTTGALKALGGGAGAILISLFSFPHKPWWQVLAAALLIALSANTLNLFDLRPGRALKVFFLWFLMLIPVGWKSGYLSLLAPMVGCVLAYAPHDLKARAMLGDTGSNMLGAALGMASVWMLSFSAQLGAVAFLFALHLFTERYSLTAIIERNRFLNFLDRLGRGGE